MQNINKDLLIFKVITLGEAGTGKTSIITRFLQNEFDMNCISTIGLSFNYKIIELKNNTKIKLKLIDTGGQEKFRALAKSYFKSANAVLFVYSKNNQESFDNIIEWIKLFNENNGKEDIPKYLVETKNDLERIVDEEKCKEFAIQNNLKWITTSAKGNESINELFQEIGELLYESYQLNHQENEKPTKVLVNDEKKKANQGHCCLFKNE